MSQIGSLIYGITHMCSCVQEMDMVFANHVVIIVKINHNFIDFYASSQSKMPKYEPILAVYEASFTFCIRWYNISCFHVDWKNPYTLYKSWRHTSPHTRISSLLLWCWFTHIVRIRAFSTAITRGLRHNTTVRQPVRRCDSEFRDVCAPGKWCQPFIASKRTVNSA